MKPPESSQSPQGNRATVPRWAAIILALFVGLIVIPLVHGGVPWAISMWMPRHGWENGIPGFWNWLGLIPVAIAAALLLWILASAISQAPARVRLGLTPSHLLTSGPYRLSRNPLYVAELGLWLGWAFFFGSIGVLIGFAVLLSIGVSSWCREKRGLWKPYLVKVILTTRTRCRAGSGDEKSSLLIRPFLHEGKQMRLPLAPAH
jgi:protein-S-isoprenylcysteine O-methyltransferase Ste14